MRAGVWILMSSSKHLKMSAFVLQRFVVYFLRIFGQISHQSTSKYNLSFMFKFKFHLVLCRTACWFYSWKWILPIFCYSYCVMFPQSLFFQISALRNTAHLTLITTPTCFGTHMYSSGCYYNKGVQTKITNCFCWKMYWVVLSVLYNEQCVRLHACVDICSWGQLRSTKVMNRMEPS